MSTNNENDNVKVEGLGAPEKQTPSPKKDGLQERYEKLLAIAEKQEKELEKLRANVASPVFLDEVTIGCLDINGITMKDRQGLLRVPVKYREEVTISQRELKDIIASNTTKWRKIFESGMLYFIDEKFYALFKMKPKFSMSEASIKKLLNAKKPADLEKEILAITNSNRDSYVVHALWYRIIDLIDKGVVGEFPYENRNLLEKYFAFPIDQAIRALREYERVTK